MRPQQTPFASRHYFATCAYGALCHLFKVYRSLLSVYTIVQVRRAITFFSREHSSIKTQINLAYYLKKHSPKDEITLLKCLLYL